MSYLSLEYNFTTKIFLPTLKRWIVNKVAPHMNYRERISTAAPVPWAFITPGMQGFYNERYIYFQQKNSYIPIKLWYY